MVRAWFLCQACARHTVHAFEVAQQNQNDHLRIKSSGAFVSDLFPILWSHPPPPPPLLVLSRVRLSNGLLGGAVLPVTTALRARSTRARPVGDMGMKVD